MSKPLLVVTAHFVDEVEARIDREFEARRKPKGARFTPEELLSASEGADAMFIAPIDRLDAAFFQRVSSAVKVIATNSVGYDTSTRAPPPNGRSRSRIPPAYQPMRSRRSLCC